MNVQLVQIFQNNYISKKNKKSYYLIVCIVLLLGQPKYELPNAVFEVEAGTSKNIPFSLSSTRAFPATTKHILKCIKADGNKVSLSKKFQTTQDTILLKNLEIEDSGT